MRRRPVHPRHHLALLANPEARFTDLGPDWHARNRDRDRKIRAHLRGLEALGLNVEISEATA